MIYLQQIKSQKVLLEFYKANNLSHKFALHLFYRSNKGNIGLFINKKLIGHGCLAYKNPWPFIYGLCKLRIALLRNKEYQLRKIGLIKNLEIANIVIDSKYRKCGYGTILLNKLLSIGRAKEKSIRLLVSLKDKPLQKWYQKNGFKIKQPYNNKLQMVFNM